MAEDRALRGVQSVERAFGLLEHVADAGDVSVTELSALLGLPAPTTHRLLKTLAALGYVRQLANRRYGPGPALIRLSGRPDAQLATIARPHLEILARETGESANLAMLDGTMIVYVEQAESVHPMRMFTESGQRAYAHSTGVGKAILSELTDRQVDLIISAAGMPGATDRTITDATRLHAELEAVRHRGFAVDDGEQELGVCCYAVALRGSPMPMALSISGPAFRMTKAVGRTAVSLLRSHAETLAQELRATIAGSNRGQQR